MKVITAALFNLVIWSTGCMSVSSLQSARTVRPGENTFFLGLSSQSATFKKDYEGELDEEIEKVSVPILEAGVRGSYAPKMDFGLKLATPNSITGEFKYMLSSPANRFMAHAVGAGLSRAAFGLGSGEDKSKFVIYDLNVPYFFTIDFSEKMGLHFSPRYMLRFTGISEPNRSRLNQTTSFVGVAVGFNLMGLIIEAGAFQAANDPQTLISQYTIGYSSAWDKLSRDQAEKRPLPK